MSWESYVGDIFEELLEAEKMSVDSETQKDINTFSNLCGGFLTIGCC